MTNTSCPRGVWNHTHGCTCPGFDRRPNDEPRETGFGSWSGPGDPTPEVEVDVDVVAYQDADGNQVDVPFARMMSWSGPLPPDDVDDGSFDAHGIPNRARRLVEAAGLDTRDLLKFSDLSVDDQNAIHRTAQEQVAAENGIKTLTVAELDRLHYDIKQRTLALFAADYDVHVKRMNDEARAEEEAAAEEERAAIEAGIRFEEDIAAIHAEHMQEALRVEHRAPSAPEPWEWEYAASLPVHDRLRVEAALEARRSIAQSRTRGDLTPISREEATNAVQAARRARLDAQQQGLWP